MPLSERRPSSSCRSPQYESSEQQPQRPRIIQSSSSNSPPPGRSLLEGPSSVVNRETTMGFPPVPAGNKPLSHTSHVSRMREMSQQKDNEDNVMSSPRRRRNGTTNSGSNPTSRARATIEANEVPDSPRSHEDFYNHAFVLNRRLMKFRNDDLEQIYLSSLSQTSVGKGFCFRALCGVWATINMAQIISEIADTCPKNWLLAGWTIFALTSLLPALPQVIFRSKIKRGEKGVKAVGKTTEMVFAVAAAIQLALAASVLQRRLVCKLCNSRKDPRGPLYPSTKEAGFSFAFGFGTQILVLLYYAIFAQMRFSAFLFPLAIFAMSGFINLIYLASGDDGMYLVIKIIFLYVSLSVCMYVGFLRVERQKRATFVTLMLEERGEIQKMAAEKQWALEWEEKFDVAEEVAGIESALHDIAGHAKISPRRNIGTICTDSVIKYIESQMARDELTKLKRSAIIDNIIERLYDPSYTIKHFDNNVNRAFPELMLYQVESKIEKLTSGRTMNEELERTRGAFFAIFWLLREHMDGRYGFCFGVNDDGEVLTHRDDEDEEAPPSENRNRSSAGLITRTPTSVKTAAPILFRTYHTDKNTKLGRRLSATDALVRLSPRRSQQQQSLLHAERVREWVTNREEKTRTRASSSRADAPSSLQSQADPMRHKQSAAANTGAGRGPSMTMASPALSNRYLSPQNKVEAPDESNLGTFTTSATPTTSGQGAGRPEPPKQAPINFGEVMSVPEEPDVEDPRSMFGKTASARTKSEDRPPTGFRPFGHVGSGRSGSPVPTTIRGTPTTSPFKHHFSQSGSPSNSREMVVGKQKSFFKMCKRERRENFLYNMPWPELRNIFVKAGVVTSDFRIVPDRMRTLLVLTAFHDICKVEALCPVVAPQHSPFYDYVAGDVINDHDIALTYILTHYPHVLPSFYDGLSAENRELVIFTQGKMGFNHGWLVQGESPPGPLFHTFKRLLETKNVSEQDVAFYFAHWITDLAGAEPTPWNGSEKFVLKFPDRVLRQFIKSFPFIFSLANETETEVFEKYLKYSWQELQAEKPYVFHDLFENAETICLQRLLLHAQKNAEFVFRAFKDLSREDRELLTSEMSMTGIVGQHFSCCTSRSGPAILVYYAPAFLQKNADTYENAKSSLQALAEVYRQGRLMFQHHYERTAKKPPEGGCAFVTIRIDQLKETDISEVAFRKNGDTDRVDRRTQVSFRQGAGEDYEGEKTFWIMMRQSSVEAQVVNVAMSELNQTIEGKTQNQDYRFCCLFRG